MTATNRQRVLRVLRAVGSAGITAVDFNGSLGTTPDGGEPITRLAARIAELRHKEGHDIVSAGTRHGCKVYVLREPAPQLDAPADPPERLFQTTLNAIRGEAA